MVEPGSSRRFRVGIDTGGTFTDVLLFDEDSKEAFVFKGLSTPREPTAGILEALRRVLSLGGGHVRDVTFLAHGTTVATNLVLEKKGADCVLVVTEGFRDLLEIGRQRRSDVYDLRLERPRPLVPRSHILEVSERVDHSGQVLEPLEQADLDEIRDAVHQLAPGAIGVCFLNSYANSVHEEEVIAAIAPHESKAFVTRSSVVSNQYREYERMMTTALNAYVGPAVSAYLTSLESALETEGLTTPPYISHSAGGLLPLATAKDLPVSTILSGPAAGVTGGIASAGEIGDRDLITLDVGGTSTDTCLVEAGHADVNTEHEFGGYPIRFSALAVHTVGAGGGSIAWLDDGRRLRVGPLSAGADPGPACYGRGGSAPTLTDAELVLGRLVPGSRLADELELDAEQARRAIDGHIASLLGVSVTEAADGIVRVSVSNMVRAIRVISVERGRDPRDLTLVAFGGAGPLVACEVATALGMSRVIVPRSPGIQCAVGLLHTDLRREFTTTRILLANEEAYSEVLATYDELDRAAREWLNDERVPESEMALERSVDARYVGQNHELRLLVGPGELDVDDLKVINDRFVEEHERRYGHHALDEPVELVTFRVTAVGRLPDLPIQKFEPGEALPPRRTRLWFGGEEYEDATVYRRDSLESGWSALGPAVITQMDTTTVIPPEWGVKVHPSGHLLLQASDD